MSEGKVTLTCGHTNETPVGIWEPWIDRQGQRCRSYSTYCPACATDASLDMVGLIESLEAENRDLCRTYWNLTVKEKNDDQR